MSAKLAAAIAVHLLTATGAVCGLLALQCAASREWQAVFAWLGMALVIDTVDGPLARKLDIASALPRFDGAVLDQVVDYLNYCVVPAFIILESGIFEKWVALVVAGAVAVTSLFHFADRSSKTTDGYFVGFPAIWNVACFYLFVFAPGPGYAIMLVVVLGALTFIPCKWVHPIRVKRFRLPTVAMGVFWSAAAIYTVVDGFPGSPGVQAILAVTVLYFIVLGLARTLGFGISEGS